MQIKLKSRIPLLAALMALTATLSALTLSAIQGQPPGHDITWGEMIGFSQIPYTMLGILIEALLFSAAICVGYALRRGWRAFSAA